MTDAEARVVKLQLIERWTLGLGAAISLAGYGFGRHVGLSISIGAALMVLNSFAIRRVGERLWKASKTGNVSAPRAVLLFNLKLLGLVAAIWAVITYLHVNPIAFLVGLSVYPLAIVAFALTHVEPATSDSIEDPNG